MITWAELFEADGSPLRNGYRHLRPAITTRAAGVLDQLVDEDWFCRDAPFVREDGSEMAKMLLRIPGCGAAVLAELEAIRDGRDGQADRGSRLQGVVAHLTGDELARVEAVRTAGGRRESRAETLRRLILAGLVQQDRQP